MTGERVHSARCHVEKFIAGADGALEPVTSGSTRLVLTATCAGICLVKRRAIRMG
jgi:hypothetical protein